MKITLTSVFQKVPEGYIGYVEELPGANTQGDTLEEARENLKEAIELVLEANRQLAEETLVGENFIAVNAAASHPGAKALRADRAARAAARATNPRPRSAGAVARRNPL